MLVLCSMFYTIKFYYNGALTNMANILNNNTNEINVLANTDNNELNDALREINGVLETAINTNTVLTTDEIEDVLRAVRGVLETITEPANNENEVLIDTLFGANENEPVESKTWTEPCFLDRMNASQALKEWADRTTDHFIELYSENMWNAHPDETAVRVPVRFHRELRNLGVQGQYWKPGNGYLWNGVWYFPADREFLIIVREE